MPIRMSGVGGGFDPKLVDQLIEAEKIPIESAKKRKEKFTTEKAEIEKLNGFINELDSTLNSLKSRTDFFKMKVESSHPDIMEGICKADASSSFFSPSGTPVPSPKLNRNTNSCDSELLLANRRSDADTRPSKKGKHS